MTGGWAATNTLRSAGGCGAISSDGALACILPIDHEGAHGWEEQERDEVYGEAYKAQVALANMRRALEWVAANDPGVGGEMCRRVLAAADGLTAPPMDLGGMVSDEAVAATLDRRAAAADGTPKDTTRPTGSSPSCSPCGSRC